MKKLLTIAVAALLSLGLTSCGTTSGVGGGKTTVAPALYEHPMTYTLDLADAKLNQEGKIVFVDNSQYGNKGRSTVQCKNGPQGSWAEWTDLVKPNKPKKGDKIRVTGVVTSDMDIDSVYVNLIDPADASGWLRIAAQSEAEEPGFPLKANEPYTIDMTFDVNANVSKSIILNMAYGEQNGGFATLKVERVTESFIGEPSGEVEVRTGPKTYEFDVSKDLTYVEIEPNYPWENNVRQTMKPPTNYQCDAADLTNLFDDADWPRVGDKVHITWKTKSSRDIAALHMFLLEHTAAVNWWKVLDANGSAGQIVAENIVAGEPFVIDATFEFAEAPIDGVSFVINYGLDEGDGSAVLTYAK